MTGQAAMTVAEVAKTLRISRTLAYQLVRKGQIPSIKIGERKILVPRAAIEKMLSDPLIDQLPMPATGSGD